MNFTELKYCPSTLAEGFTTYSPAAIRNMFYGKKVSHILEFNPPEMDDEVAEQFRLNSKITSISGAQFKQSFILEKNKLRLSKENEKGQYILKPIPSRQPFGKVEELPANEHLTMQIAKQAYNIKTAESALLFFKNGEPAYITKRFDIGEDGSKIAQEDFATLSGRSKEIDGKFYKTKGSYEDMAQVMKKYVSAFIPEVEKYFQLIIFNYLFSNEDAHLKNFSLRQTSEGDYVLSPAYDLTNTIIHIPDDSFFALEDGLFSNNFETESFKVLGYFAYDDFYEFGIKIGVRKNRLVGILDKYRLENQKVLALINRSFLSDPVKELYRKQYLERLKMLNTSFSKLI